MQGVGLGRRRPRRLPWLSEVEEQLLPQLVPAALMEDAAVGARDLVTIRHLGDIAVAFVIDEPDRYTYVHRGLLRKWRIAETDLLALALRNLKLYSQLTPPSRIGRGKRLSLVWEACDGYDASRLLLTRQLCDAAVHVQGNPIIAVPHRDYMVMFGDRDPAFVEEMADRIYEEYAYHRYPISGQLYTLSHGMLMPYSDRSRLGRVLN